MPDEKRNEVTNTTEQPGTDVSQYISAINEMKSSTVSKESFEKLQKENKELLKSLVNGTPAGDSVASKIQEKSVEVDELRKDLYSKEKVQNLSNLDFIKKTLILREKIMDNGEQDPFLPSGANSQVTSIDVEEAEKVADVLEQCVEQANGSSEVFTALLQSRMSDPFIPKKRR